MSKIVIDVEKVGKKFLLKHQLKGSSNYRTLRDSIIEKAKNLSTFIFNRSSIESYENSNEDFWSLKDVSFSVPEGSKIGIIGQNGAGKSTLLKIMSRITDPSEGRITINGRIASLLEVGTGFHPELTGRENIFLNGAILGLKKNEIVKKFDEIVAFAEIEKFLDTPVKKYSSGMYVRLAFAVSAHLEPEILIVDEVLSVGDAKFQNKCLSKMENISDSFGRTVLFVSHNMAAIKRLCSSCLLLENGRLVAFGPTPEIVNLYLEKSSNSISSEIKYSQSSQKEFQVLSVRLLDELGELRGSYECDQAIFVEITCISKKNIPGLYGYLSLRKAGEEILVSDTYDIDTSTLSSIQEGTYKIIVKIPNRTIGHGKYSVFLSFSSTQSNQGHGVDSPRDLCSFEINDHSTSRGNKRDGHFSTLLKWHVEKINEPL